MPVPQRKVRPTQRISSHSSAPRGLLSSSTSRTLRSAASGLSRAGPAANPMRSPRPTGTLTREPGSGTKGAS